MTEARRYRTLLLTIQDRIKALGSSNRNRWAAISMEQSLGLNEFVDKLRFLGNMTTEEEVRNIWKAVGINGNSIQFIDFLKIMQSDPDELKVNTSGLSNQSYNEEPRYEASAPSYGRSNDYGQSNRNQSVSIKKYIKEITADCMAADYDTSGEIPMKTFTDICSKFGIDSRDSEFMSIVRQNDPGNSGYVSYFLLAAQVCQLESLPPARSEPIQQQYRSSMASATFSSEPTPSHSNSGKRMSPNELASYISQVAYDKLTSVRNAFNRWRGYNDTITSELLYEGLKKDGGIEVSFSDVDNLVQSYGGNVNLNNFVRMLSATPTPTTSSHSSTLSSVPNRKMTADEETIYQLASQIREPGWENVIMKSRSTDEMILGFQQMGIQIDDNRLRIITSKLGRSGLVETLRTKIQ